jgi:NDP-sugar pyrophosphorylase family protein
LKPTLLILAAGMGSRYGGLKQVDGVGPEGEAILDYSIFDALRAGFGKIVFVIRRDIETIIKEAFIDRWSEKVKIEYVFQDLDDLPGGFSPTADRVKPWGTGHAIWVARDKIHEPFAMINADDFYGRESYQLAAGFLSDMDNLLFGKYCLVGYVLKNTLSEHGHVSRAECTLDEGGLLETITERLKISGTIGGVVYEDHGVEATIDEETIVSMNMWGFMPSIFKHLEEQMVDFLEDNAGDDRAEFLLPTVIDKLVDTARVEIPVLKTGEKWFGMTYPEDRELVTQKLQKLADRKSYPVPVWK